MRRRLPEGRIEDRIVAALADDLNTPGVIAALHAIANEAKKSDQSAADLMASMQFLGILDKTNPKANETFGSILQRGEHPALNLLEGRLDELYKVAKRSKDFSNVDSLKNGLLDAGVEVQISRFGVNLVATPDFDPSKLEALK